MAQQQTQLTQQQQQDLIRVEHNLSALLTDLDKAGNCGIDCDQLRAMATQLIEESQTLRTNFGR